MFASPAYRHLLVPVDYTGCAWEVADHAARIARPMGARITLLYAVRPPVGAHEGDRAAGGTVGEVLDHEAQSQLEAIRATLGPDLQVEIALVHGEPVKVICEAIRERQADLVVMGTHARQGLRRLVLGSVAEHVIRRSVVPVLVVRGAREVADAPSEAWLQVQAETEG